MASDRPVRFWLYHQTGTSGGVGTMTLHYQYGALQLERPATGVLAGYVRCQVCGGQVPVRVRSHRGELIRTLRLIAVMAVAVAAAGLALWFVWFAPSAHAGATGADDLDLQPLVIAMVLVALVVVVGGALAALANRTGVSVRLAGGSRWHSVRRVRPGQRLAATPARLLTGERSAGHDDPFAT